MNLSKKYFPLLFLLVFILILSSSVNAQESSVEKRLKALEQKNSELEKKYKALEQKYESLKVEKGLKEAEKWVEEKEQKDKEQDQTISSLSSYVDKRIEKFSIFPDSKLFLSGYGAVGFQNQESDESTFNALFAPIFHYQHSDRLHFLIEGEFELEDDENSFSLEIGEADIFINDYLTLVAGKFLVPFNTFSERLHPTWINKMPDPPLIYGHGGHGGHDSPTTGIVPILTDVGFQIRGGAPLPIAKGSKINYAFYIVNGPRAVIEDEHSEGEDDEHSDEGDEHVDELMAALNQEDEHEEDEHEDEGGGGSVDLVFGSNFDDINDNKTVGGRIGFLPVWNVELGASFMYGEAADDIDFYLLGFDGQFQYRGLNVLAEYIRRENDLPGGGDEDVDGYYAQASYRLSGLSVGNGMTDQIINGLEPVVRVGQIFQEGNDISQVAVGLNFWYLPSVPFKVAYQFNDEIPDSFLFQWAFGF